MPRASPGEHHMLRRFYDSANATLPSLPTLRPDEYGSQWAEVVKGRQGWEPKCAHMQASPCP